MLVRRFCLALTGSRALAAGAVAAAAMLLPVLSAVVGRGTAAFAADPNQANQTHVRTQTSDTLELAGLEKSFANVADRVAPTVVAISASVSAVDTDDAVQTDQLNSQRLRSILDRVTRTVGTGLIIDAGGYILTNEHVVGDAEQLWVTTDDKHVYPAVIVGSDPRSDLAVLKIPAKELPVVKFAPAGAVRRGQWTIALGNPYGLASAGEMAMSVGIVSALDRSLPALSKKENRIYSGLIQTTAEINPGNSGGPLFDINGQVIGVTTAVILPQKQTNGIGFAMPITPRLMEIVDTLKAGREVVYGYMGVTVNTPSARERRAAGVHGEVGVTIESIEPSSPAAGTLRADDVLVSVDGRWVTDSDEFVDVIGAAQVDHVAKVSVYREGKPMMLDIPIARRPMPQVAVTNQNQRLHWRGMLLGPIPANWIAEKGRKIASGVMVLAVNKDSPMLKEGVTSGSIIISIAGKQVAAITDLQSVINETPAEKCSIQLADGPANAVAAGPARGN
jgi:serine protease Do